MIRAARAARASLVALLVSAGVAFALDFGSVAGQVFTGGTVSGQAYSLPAAGGETTPATIFGSKLVAWYRPDTGYVSVDGSNNVTQLDDRSGNGHHLNVVGGTPLLTTDGGDPCIDFEAADADYLGIASAPLTNEPIVVYVVADLESSASARTLWALSKTTSNDNQWFLRINTGTPVLVAVSRTTAESLATHGDTLSLATRYVFRGDFTADDARAANVNGGTEATDSGSRTVGTPNQMSIGSRRADASSAVHDGRGFEWVVLNAAPTAGEDAAYLAYTTDRFGTPP